MMKRLLFLILFLLTITQLRAPESSVLIIMRTESISRYGELIEAITWVESKHGSETWNPIEKAVGWFQIRQVRVDDYNKRRGTNYKLIDFFDYKLSKEMFLYYADGKSFEQAAKNWNGSGPKTIDYWRKVKQKLNE